MFYDERDQEPTAEQFELLEQIQAHEAAPFAPDDIAELDGLTPTDGWDAHDDHRPDPFASTLGNAWGMP